MGLNGDDAGHGTDREVASSNPCLHSNLLPALLTLRVVGSVSSPSDDMKN